MVRGMNKFGYEKNIGVYSDIEEDFQSQLRVAKFCLSILRTHRNGCRTILRTKANHLKTIVTKESPFFLKKALMLIMRYKLQQAGLNQKLL